MKIISGGQTGVDRAALDAAILVGMDYGGSIPKGRKAEDGPISDRYVKLKEMPTGRYRDRTERNVMDGDATLILTRGKPTYGTAYTIRCLERSRKKFLVIDIGKINHVFTVVKMVEEWLRSTRPGVLNVAGPRESKSPGIYLQAMEIITAVFRNLTRE